MKLISTIRNKILRNNSEQKYSEGLIDTLPNFSSLYSSQEVAINNNSSELEVNINRLTSFILKDLVPIVGLSPYPISEQILMASAVVSLKPDYIFEWGTHLGVSARIFHEICNKYQIDAIIHSIDLPDNIDHIEHPRSNRGIKVKGISNVNLHQGDGLDKSLEIAGNLNQNAKLLFFLDGDHEYESVSRELAGIHTKFPKANILAHDTFYQSEDSKYNIGPYLAIKDFLKKHPDSYKILSTDFGLPGMTLLYNKNG